MDCTPLTVVCRNFILRIDSSDGLLLGIFERRAVVREKNSGVKLHAKGGHLARKKNHHNLKNTKGGHLLWKKIEDEKKKKRKKKLLKVFERLY